MERDPSTPAPPLETTPVLPRGAIDRWVRPFARFLEIEAASGLVLLACAGCAAWTPGEASEDFYAYYTRIDSGEPFEQYARVGEHADIIVRLKKQQGQLVFWRGSSYLPCWETPNGRWYLNEVIPRSGDGEGPMPDRVNTYSRVFLIETSPERIVVHWRYLPQFQGTNPHEGVDAVHFPDRQSKAPGPLQQIPAGHVRGAGGDRPRVVLADEQDGQIPDDGQVQRLQQHALVHRPFAEEGHRDLAGPEVLRRQPEARRRRA